MFALGGVGENLDFVIYSHSIDRPEASTHDHLLVFRHRALGERSLVFSCAGDLPRKGAALSAAVASGRCAEESSPVETH